MSTGSDDPADPIEQFTDRMVRLFVATLLAILCASTVYGFFASEVLFTAEPGLAWNSFGDAFGVVNAVVSLFAFAAMVATLFLQSRELRLQRKELQDTRTVLASQGEVQQEQRQLQLLAYVYEHGSGFRLREPRIEPKDPKLLILPLGSSDPVRVIAYESSHSSPSTSGVPLLPHQAHDLQIGLSKVPEDDSETLTIMLLVENSRGGWFMYRGEFKSSVSATGVRSFSRASRRQEVSGARLDVNGHPMAWPPRGQLAAWWAIYDAAVADAE